MQESPVLTSIPETNLGAKGKGVKGDFNFSQNIEQCVMQKGFLANLYVPLSFLNIAKSSVTNETFLGN